MVGYPPLDLFSFGYHVSGYELIGDLIIVDKRIVEYTSFQVINQFIFRHIHKTAHVAEVNGPELVERCR